MKIVNVKQKKTKSGGVNMGNTIINIMGVEKRLPFNNCRMEWLIKENRDEKSFNISDARYALLKISSSTLHAFLTPRGKRSKFSTVEDILV